MVIRVENLTKEFKQRKARAGLMGAIKDLFHREYRIIKAVDHISFSINKGEVVGYIGPNGAGKSTTMKILCGILVPTNGLAEVNGIIPYERREQNARKIGVVFGQRTQLWWDLPLSETLDLMKYMYDIPNQRYQENLRSFSEILGIDKFIHTPVRQLSLGQRMRADLACALLHDPDILYLDEPTIGLDVVVKENVREFLREVNKSRHTTILLATHDMFDIEKVCSRALVIHQGKIMYDGSLDKLKNDYGSESTLKAELADTVAGIDGLSIPGIHEMNLNGTNLIVKYDKNAVNSAAILRWLADRTIIRDFRVTEASVEDIIRKMYKGFSQ